MSMVQASATREGERQAKTKAYRGFQTLSHENEKSVKLKHVGSSDVGAGLSAGLIERIPAALSFRD